MPSKLPHYRQLYEMLRQQILDGLFPPGTCLPSSRALAAQFKLSRNTAIAALNQLCAEGYAVARPASGIYVSSTLSAHWDTHDFKPTAKRLGLSSRGEKISQDAHRPNRSGAFTPGIPDLKQFPFALWQRYVARYARNPRLNWLAYPYQGGHHELRAAIAEQLRITRGIQCHSRQVLITHGTQNSLRLAADLLADSGDRVWVENPGYPGARSAFIAAGLKLVGQPLDTEGLAPTIQAWQKPPRLIYVTPSHQYPLGIVMSASRRQQLLMQAAQHHTWVIEDDYDSEFRYAGPPLAALQALSPEQVIYLGTFSKTLFPALRIGYMVLPDKLVDAFRAAQARHFREPAYIIQNALADFIGDGHYSAHLRKMRQEYQFRGAALINLLTEELGTQVQIPNFSTGLHLTALLSPGSNDLAIEEAADHHGIVACALQRYFFQSKPTLTPGLVLGFGNTTLKNIDHAGKILIKIIRKYSQCGKAPLRIKCG
jgi:GntR family transcriptional regulator / MocR family aminotransferase